MLCHIFGGILNLGQRYSDNQYSPEETERWMTDAIRRALNTPPKLHKEMIGKRGVPRRSQRANAQTSSPTPDTNEPERIPL
jgi:hypothetical protein